MYHKQLLEMLEQQQSLLRNANQFLSHISLNRYLSFDLTDLDFSNGKYLIQLLECEQFSIQENYLTYIGYSTGRNDFHSIMTEIQQVYGKEDWHWIDFLLYQNKLYSDSFLANTLPIESLSTVTYGEFLSSFVMGRSDMGIGDTPPLTLIFTATKALLAKHYLTENINRLALGEMELVDITPYM
jgi:hypothetical protein